MHPPFPMSAAKATGYGFPDFVRWYDTLASLGLHPIPKAYMDKRPVYDYVGRAFPSRSEALECARSGEADGWFLYPHREEVKILVVDMDIADIRNNGNDPAAVYEQLQAICETKFVVYTPSGGVHLYYRLEEGQVWPDRPTPRKDIRGLEVRTPAIEVGIATFCGLAQYSGPKALKKGVKDGHVGSYDPAPYGEYATLTLANEALLTFFQSEEPEYHASQTVDDDTAPDKRLVRLHNELPSDRKSAKTIEAIPFAIKSMTGDYEDWLAFWMSAWHACDGDENVMQFIIDSPDIDWSDGRKGIAKFRRDWTKHEPREDGFTVATLFKMAYMSGWLAESSADNLVGTDIMFPRMSEWIETLDTIPRTVLVKSQTGSGKSYGLKMLWERLDKPKTLVLVPSVRLAMDMTSTLRDELSMPATSYRDEDTGEVLPDSYLIGADILVSTLQTFIRRLFIPDSDVMKRYGLVYIEECDQLLASFASGGGGEISSHVRQNEAEYGFIAMAEAFRDCCVWGVDATATEVSFKAFSVLSGDDFLFVDNKYITPKPDVGFISEAMAAYSLIQTKLSEGKSVVVACDTASEAVSVYDTMLALGVVTPALALCITARTATEDRRVIEFSRNANQEAPRYRLMVYNSAMASGVSVTSYTPDVVVQMSRGYLTPRVQLQLLNRYRRQNEVYCYYGSKNMTDASFTSDDLVRLYYDRAQAEAEYLMLPLLDRTRLTSLRDELRAIYNSDAQQQRRNPVQFYCKLLKGDGRNVKVITKSVIFQRVVDYYKHQKELRAEEMEYLTQSWYETEPKNEKFPPEWTPMQIRQSLMHQWVKDTLKGNVPSGEDYSYIFDTCKQLYKKSSALHAFVFQEDAVRFSERALANKERALMTHPSHVSRVILAGLLRYLFRHPTERLSTDVMVARAMPFLRSVTENEDVYNRIIHRPDRKLAVLKELYAGDESALAVVVAKTVAAQIGLKIRKDKADWHIANLQSVLDFLRWQNYGTEVSIDLTSRVVEEVRERRSGLLSLYSRLSDDDMRRVVAKLTNMPLETALATVML